MGTTTITSSSFGERRTNNNYNNNSYINYNNTIYHQQSPLLGSLQDTVVPDSNALARLKAEESIRFGLEEDINNSVFPPPHDVMWADDDWEPGSGGSLGVKEEEEEEGNGEEGKV